jgi:hypothetical protein
LDALGADPLRPGPHTLDVNGIAQRHHVHGSGPVCLAHPGGPGVFWEYLRMPAVEQHLTMVYMERSVRANPAASGRIPMVIPAVSMLRLWTG